MKIAIVDPSLFTIPYDEHLCRGLSEQGHQVTLYGRALRAAENLNANGFAFKPWFYGRSEVWLGRGRRGALALKLLEHALGLWRLVAEVRRGNIEAVHIQWAPVAWLDRWMIQRLRRHTPVVLTVHDTNPFLGSASSGLQTLGLAKLLRAPDALVVHTQHSHHTLVASGQDAERIHVVAHGPLQHAEPEAPHEPDDALLALQEACADTPHRLLLFGTLKPYKGADVLLRAVAQLDPALRRDCAVLICGEVRMPRAELDALAQELGLSEQIHWYPQRIPDAAVAAICALATIRVFPYRDIDASGSLLQALPLGTPIVATKVGGFPELIAEGESGLLVAPEAPAELAEAMSRIMSDPDLARNLGQGAVTAAAAIPSWRAIADRSVKLYQSLKRSKETM